MRVLFVGESPPASGRFFYRADSGLYRAVRDGFVRLFPHLDGTHFLSAFQEMDCYLVDLCGSPVDQLNRAERKTACVDGEIRLARMLRRLRPEVVITVVRSIGGNVKRSEQRAGWAGRHVELPYPGRWHKHRAAFLRGLATVPFPQVCR